MISEVDVKDYSEEFAEYQPTIEPKKLYELPRGSLFKVSDYEYLIKLINIDGMFSYCVVKEGSDKDKVIHIAAFSDVVQYVKSSVKDIMN